jgi:hypothetical protein
MWRAMFTLVYVGLAIGIPAITYGICEFANRGR